MVRKQAIRSLWRGIGSMDYIETLLIMEDELDEDENFGELDNSATEHATGYTLADSHTSNPDPVSPNMQEAGDSGLVPDWCVCGRRHPHATRSCYKCHLRHEEQNRYLCPSGHWQLSISVVPTK